MKEFVKQIVVDNTTVSLYIEDKKLSLVTDSTERHHEIIGTMNVLMFLEKTKNIVPSFVEMYEEAIFVLSQQFDLEIVEEETFKLAA